MTQFPGGEVNYLVDDEIRHGNARSGRTRVVALREQVEIAIGLGEGTDEAADACVLLMNDVRRLAAELTRDAARFDEPEVILAAAERYGELKELLQELLTALLDDAVGLFPAALSAVEQKVVEIDESLASPIADAPTA